jgi:hypothetical protein
MGLGRSGGEHIVKHCFILLIKSENILLNIFFMQLSKREMRTCTAHTSKIETEHKTSKTEHTSETEPRHEMTIFSHIEHISHKYPIKVIFSHK